MSMLEPPYGKVSGLRPLYDDYMKYKHAKTDAERNDAIERMLKVHNMDILKLEQENSVTR